MEEGLLQEVQIANRAISSIGPEVQLLLRLHYKHLLYTNRPLPTLVEVGFSVYSESDEDGILHYIFSVSGEATKKLIDLGAGGIEGSNSTNLLINHGWSGLLVDADSEKVQSLQAFYTGARATRIFPPTCICAQLTAENVNAILLDGKRVLSCLALAAQCDGREVTTIEGLASDGHLHPLQKAFIRHDAFQCGYCTSGQIMSAAALLKEGRAGSDEEIREFMSGNLCRCGAYPNIVAAIREVAGRGNE